MLIQGREFVVHIQRYSKYITERFCLLYNLVRNMLYNIYASEYDLVT